MHDMLDVMSTTLDAHPRLARSCPEARRGRDHPAVPADFLDLFAPLRAGAELRGRIESVHPETADAATLVIRPGADWAGHVPGPVRPRSASTSTACATGAPTR